MNDTLTKDLEVTFISNLALARFKKIVSSINFISQKMDIRESFQFVSYLCFR